MGLGEMFLDKKAENTFKHYLVLVFHYLNRAADKPSYEDFRRRVEVCGGIAEPEADDFRRMIASFFGQLDLYNKPFSYDTNPKLKAAILDFIRIYPDEDVPEYPFFGLKQGKYRSIDAPWEAS